MATVTKVGTPSISTTVPCPAHHISGLVAGAAIAAGDLVYIGSAGTVLQSNGTSANAAAKCDGIALQAAAIGEAVSVYNDVNVRYGSGMTPGTRLYVQTTAGLISDAATTGGTAPIGFVIDATRIRIHGSRY
jgi:hypothetical protein